MVSIPQSTIGKPKGSLLLSRLPNPQFPSVLYKSTASRLYVPLSPLMAIVPFHCKNFPAPPEAHILLPNKIYLPHLLTSQSSFYYYIYIYIWNSFPETYDPNGRVNNRIYRGPGKPPPEEQGHFKGQQTWRNLGIEMELSGSKQILKTSLNTQGETTLSM